jgi:aldehyde dehydrogenase (NAD+)
LNVERAVAPAEGDGVQDADDGSNGHGPTFNVQRSTFDTPPIDRTPKMFVAGKQARPDSGYSRPVYGAAGELLGQVGEGNRKDIRNAVEAARAARAWGAQTAHGRAQVVYYIAENLSARAGEFARRLRQAGASAEDAASEVDAAVAHLFTFAAWADKYDGAVHHTPTRTVTLAVPEPIGVIGAACPDERPLAAFVALMAAGIAMGNALVVVPSERFPLAATDLYQVLETSDVPAGVVNIVSGARDALAEVLAAHADVDALWYFGGDAGVAAVERASAGNLKRTWAERAPRNWLALGDTTLFLRHATQVKNIWVPYGA